MLEVNLRNRAVSQHTRNYNSMCLVGADIIGASETGLYRIGGRTDHGAQIPALIKSGMTDFGAGKKKRFRYFRFGLLTDGELLFKVYCEKALAGEYAVEPGDSEEMSVVVPISRAHSGRYWSWSVENVNGAFFVLYSVHGMPIVLGRLRG